MATGANEVNSDIDFIYSNLCPVCGEDLTKKEVESGKCSKNGELCRMDVDDTVMEFLSFFKKCVGEARSIQKMWAKRILRGESFAATAPTGIGKTSFGIVMSLFLATKGKKCYIILPTSLLLNQCVENLKIFALRSGVRLSDGESEGVKFGYYHGRMKKSEKERFFSMIGEFDVLITTTQFLSRNFDHLRGNVYDFIFVDDVDSVLKASKNVDRILHLLGFRERNGVWEGEARGSLMVSTATAKKGRKAELFRKLLNFDVGSSRFAARNVEDFAIRCDNLPGLIRRILKELGDGGIIYARTAEEAENLYEKLRDLKIGVVTSGTGISVFNRFAEGELDYLIGTAHYYGSLVRGLDLPERIKFVIFAGCPVFRIKVEDIDSVSTGMLRTLAMLYRDEEEIGKFIPLLNKIDRDEKLEKNLRDALKRVVARGGEKARDIVFREGELIFPDVRTYIQGSGRTSRLYAGGITKGASFIVESDAEVLKAFIERSRYYDIEFKEMDVEALNQIDFAKLRRELEESRKGYGGKTETDVVKPALFIVESPTKAKQISRFFGRASVKISDGVAIYEIPTERFLLLITASIGHVTDLITNRGFHGVEVNGKFVPVYASIKRCRDCGYQFTEERKDCPKCSSENVDDSKRRIEVMRRLAHDAEFVIIGTDPDTEGEKIAWDLKNLLSGCGVIKRAEFHEVTKRAVSEALSNLRDVDTNYVKAQILRRIEDRWIGFVLSHKLWEVFNNRNLSAGRAQTPVLGWIIERHEKSRKKRTMAFIRDLELSFELKPDEAKEIGESSEIEIEVELVEEREDERIPLPPYTTDSLLRDANQILKIGAKETMQLAQDLFENGIITYHRTDSTRVSEVGLRIAREYLGSDFEGREWRAEGAHECIRPTRAVDRDTLQRLIHEGVINVEGLSWRHFALYDLIFRRFMASQCKPYRVTVKKYRVRFIREFEEERVVRAEGRAYELFKSVWVKKELPTGRIRVQVEIRKLPEAPLYTQSEIVQLMRERGIGRPSTYATIIDRLFLRKYVGERNGRVYPTRLGMSVYEYLSKNYSSFVSEERTRLLEEKMDAVERGEVDFLDALNELYEEIRGID